MNSRKNETGALSGYRVLDLADEKGMLCSRLLADMGADVIKTEKPGGDATRNTGPFLNDVPHPERSLYYWYYNVGKRSITLDLETQDGLRAFRWLAAEADIVVETFQPGYLTNLDADYDKLSRSNPGLIMASISGFGQTGPYRDFHSCDLIAAATGGQMHVCGDTNTPPLKLFGDQACNTASIFAAVGILLALRTRRMTRMGQHIDISLQECVAATLDHVLVSYFYQDSVAKRQGSLHWSNAFRLFPCKDDLILLSIFRNWDTLVEWLHSDGASQDLEDRRWHDTAARHDGRDYVTRVLERWTQVRSAGDLEERGQLMGFPWAKVASPAELARSLQLNDRNFFARVAHPETGKEFLYPGSFCRLSSSSWEIGRRAPLIGEHNVDVYEGELGLKVNDLDALESTSFTTSTGEKPTRPEETGQIESPCKLPLDGIRVLDFSRVLAGPYATRLLADFGAQVIKVEPPAEEETDSFAKGYYQTWNRNKLSIVLDASRPEGVEIAKKLISNSDVVVENFSPRVMANWGLDYPRIRDMKPDVIMVSLSVMGQTGPYRNYVGFGPTVHALAGMTYLTAFPDKPAVGPGHSYADHVAALAGVMAVLSALEQRSRTGQGQYIDISLTEVMCSLLGPALLEWLINGHEPKPMGNRSSEAAPHGCYRCHGDDAWCAIAVRSDGEWRSLSRVMGNPAWAGEPGFSTATERLKHSDELDRLLERWTQTLAPEEVEKALQRAGVAAGKIHDASDLALNPQLNTRGFFIEMDYPELGMVKSDASPVRMSSTPAQYRHPAPAPGQDSDYVFRTILGLTDEELSSLRQQKIIG